MYLKPKRIFVHTKKEKNTYIIRTYICSIEYRLMPVQSIKCRG